MEYPSVKLINYVESLLEGDGHKHLTHTAGGREQTEMMILLKLQGKTFAVKRHILGGKGWMAVSIGSCNQ